MNEARVVVGSVCALDSGALDRPRGRRPDPTADSQRLKHSKIVCLTKRDHCRHKKRTVLDTYERGIMQSCSN